MRQRWFLVELVFGFASRIDSRVALAVAHQKKKFTYPGRDSSLG
jgi:hypothetical protein